MLLWLDSICDPHRKNAPSFVSSPRTALISEEVYTVASDGSRVVFYPGDHGYDRTDRDEDREAACFFEPHRSSRCRSVALGVLRRWADEAVPCKQAAQHGRDETCRACKGSGKIACECIDCGDKHQAACETCRTTGRLATAICAECSYDPTVSTQTDRPGWIADGVLINRRLFDTILPHVPDNTLDISTASAHDPIHFRGASGLRFILMPLRFERGENCTSRLTDHLSRPTIGRKAKSSQL